MVSSGQSSLEGLLKYCQMYISLFFVFFEYLSLSSAYLFLSLFLTLTPFLLRMFLSNSFRLFHSATPLVYIFSLSLTLSYFFSFTLSLSYFFHISLFRYLSFTPCSYLFTQLTLSKLIFFLCRCFSLSFSLYYFSVFFSATIPFVGF